jgi:hypothetical protein
MRRRSTRALLLVGTLALTGVAANESTTGTLALDGLSFVSFSDEDVYSIPAGATMRFRFGTPAGGEVPIVVEPQDLNVGELRLRSGGGLMQLGLVRRAVGRAFRSSDGSLAIELDALVSVIVKHPEYGGARTVRLHLTTEAAQATGTDGLGARSLSGMRLASGSRGIQLVGAVANDADTYPAPGAVVLVVLSGAFDAPPPP